MLGQVSTLDVCCGPGNGATQTPGGNRKTVRTAQTLNGYLQVGGEARDLGTHVDKLGKQPLDALSLDDLRILLFARQRAHYHQGGGWPDGDPIMDEMRVLTALIRSRLEHHRTGHRSISRL